MSKEVLVAIAIKMFADTKVIFLNITLNSKT